MRKSNGGQRTCVLSLLDEDLFFGFILSFFLHKGDFQTIFLDNGHSQLKSDFLNLTKTSVTKTTKARFELAMAVFEKITINNDKKIDQNSAFLENSYSQPRSDFLNLTNIRRTKIPKARSGLAIAVFEKITMNNDKKMGENSTFLQNSYSQHKSDFLNLIKI